MIRAPFLLATAALTALAGCSGSTKGAEAPLPKMIAVPGGTFTMGAPPDADAQQGKPQHQVSIRPFRLGETEVTFDQYDAFARATGRALPQDDGLGRGGRPVINIDLADMLAYTGWLNRSSGQTGFRLPSEAEWEYAARAGTTTGFYWGDEPDPNRANTRANTGADSFEFTAPVKSFPANPWGFFDMAGNVWEMTADCRYPDYAGAPADGSARTGPDCFSHIARGGDYSSSRRGQRPTARVAAGEKFRSTSLGFRVAQDM
ncbi:formylglycine-generating enzyme family protein [Sphingomonas canadensis]|uniref:Formylglycine-generating enzyme family protein n=1 Tax=Sphingomonas canadensis TaxID=1219257 RepID=A0ABW3HFW2_9SPHN|nr:formylglycine-generating enzyme family protein [Sphingomonas canadensis]MCW3838291.1 formylglycine-generating enzyme family protein [Sphingomonas canadensis]